MPSIPVLSNIMGGSDPASSELVGNVPQASNAKVLQQRDEEIFYNSATAPGEVALLLQLSWLEQSYVQTIRL